MRGRLCWRCVNIFQSHVQDGLYFTSYTIEPLLELLWAEDSIQTRYTVLFPITTPPTPQNPHVLDSKLSSAFSWSPFHGLKVGSTPLLGSQTPFPCRSASNFHLGLSPPTWFYWTSAFPLRFCPCLSASAEAFRLWRKCPSTAAPSISIFKYPLRIL